MMMNLYARALVASSATAALTCGVGFGAFSWEARRPQSRFETLKYTMAAIGMGSLAGVFLGPSTYPLMTLLYHHDYSKDWEMIERTKDKFVLESMEPPKDFLIRNMNEGRRSRGLPPRFADPPGRERIIINH